MSHSRARLVATLLAVGLGLAQGLTTTASATGQGWALLPLRLGQGDPVFALAADPARSDVVLVGTAQGRIYRSQDGGASWTAVREGPGAVLTLAFDPLQPGLVVAGTRGDGIWRSPDGGLSWRPDPGTAGSTVRALAFAPGLELAGTDAGVLASRSGQPWVASGLGGVRVSALAVTADGLPATVIAGGDDQRGRRGLPLYTSDTGGQRWSPVPAGPSGFAGASMVASLVAASAPAGRSVVLMGTNTGLFRSRDGGGSWSQLIAGGALPATDFSAAAFVPGHPGQFYVASDGGGSDQGGLWMTQDGGAHFSSLAPPVRPVTAIAVSGGMVPTVYAATYSPDDQTVRLWSYSGTGEPSATPAPVVARGAHSSSPPSSRERLQALLRQPQTPWVGLGTAALVVVLVALVAYARRERRL